VGAGDLPHLLGALNAGEGRELLDVAAVRAPGARVVEVGKPLQLPGHLAQPLELGAAQAFAFRFQSDPQGMAVWGAFNHRGAVLVLITGFINTN
jgi:hypothetical protein